MPGNRREFEVKTFSVTNAAVSSGALEDLVDSNSRADIVLEGNYPEIVFEATNSGTALQDFAILVLVHEDSTVWHVYMSTTADFTSTTKQVKPWASDDGDIPTLADADTMAARFHIGAVYAVKFQAQSSGADTDVTVRGQAWRHSA
jgi:hypothetical protein